MFTHDRPHRHTCTPTRPHRHGHAAHSRVALMPPGCQSATWARRTPTRKPCQAGPGRPRHPPRPDCRHRARGRSCRRAPSRSPSRSLSRSLLLSPSWVLIRCYCGQRRVWDDSSQVFGRSSARLPGVCRGPAGSCSATRGDTPVMLGVFSTGTASPRGPWCSCCPHRRGVLPAARVPQCRTRQRVSDRDHVYRGDSHRV